MGWCKTIDLSSGAIVQVQQQMWYPGLNGEQGALRICGLPGVEGMRRDELRTLLAAQPDFVNVKPEIQEEVERCGDTSFYLDLNATLSACTLKCAGHM